MHTQDEARHRRLIRINARLRAERAAHASKLADITTLTAALAARPTVQTTQGDVAARLTQILDAPLTVKEQTHG